MDPTVSDGPGAPAYRSRRLPLALGGSVAAGSVSGLLGIGGGVVTVPLLHLLMQAPMRVAVATSNYMIGMTGAAGAYAYLLRGEVDPRQAAPVVLGRGGRRGGRGPDRPADPVDLAHRHLRGRPGLRHGRDGPTRAGLDVMGDNDLGRAIGRVLRIGSLGSFVAIGVGLAWALVTSAPSAGARPLTTLVADGGPDAVTAIGLLALTLAPAVGLVVAGLVLWRRGERARAAVALTAIALLAVSVGIAFIVVPI